VAEANADSSASLRNDKQEGQRQTQGQRQTNASCYDFHPRRKAAKEPMNDAQTQTAGARFRAAVRNETPLQLAGATTAYHALLAERAGFRALYLSGGGVAASSLGIPDLGISTLEDVLIDVRRITAVSSLPLLVDADTGFGSAFNIARTVRSLTQAGAAGCHIEDQVAAKRCGHRPNKQIVPLTEMVDRIKAAVDARTDASFVVMARTDALAVEGMSAALDRAAACAEAGAEMIFPEAVNELGQYSEFAARVKLPVLANITEFGATPLFTVEELRSAGAAIVLYPLSAFRAASAAALNVYQQLRREGTQAGVLGTMQTRAELYDVLGYHAYEQKLDALYADKNEE
jgi:methylisocitrate lyase